MEVREGESALSDLDDDRKNNDIPADHHQGLNGIRHRIAQQPAESAAVFGMGRFGGVQGAAQHGRFVFALVRLFGSLRSGVFTCASAADQEIGEQSGEPMHGQHDISCRRFMHQPGRDDDQNQHRIAKMGKGGQFAKHPDR